MRFDSFTVSRRDGATHIEARVADRTMTFAVSGTDMVGDVASAVLATIHYPAMHLGDGIVLPPGMPVSPRLLANLERLQEIRLGWYPSLHPVTIEAAEVVASTGNDAGGLLFSGGVDALYSYICNEDRITDLIFCIGLDIQHNEHARIEAALRLGHEFAAGRGKRFISIDTNAGQLWPGVAFAPYHGQFFASMALLLGCRTGIIAASYSYAGLRAWGSHPMTDELIATEWTTTRHHGLVSRAVKIARIAEEPDCLAMLRVCNASPEYNCGKCEKCLRTKVALQLLGKSTPTLPGTARPADIRALRLYNAAKAEFWHENLTMAEAAGDRGMIAAIRTALLRYHRRAAVKDLLNAMRGRIELHT